MPRAKTQYDIVKTAYVVGSSTMMPSPDLERTARLIAENVASAIEHEHEHDALHPLIREALVVELLRALLPAMAAQSSVALVEACNRCLGHFAGLVPPVPQVETIDLDDGWVTMRAE